MCILLSLFTHTTRFRWFWEGDPRKHSEFLSETRPTGPLRLRRFFGREKTTEPKLLCRKSVGRLKKTDTTKTSVSKCAYEYSRWLLCKRSTAGRIFSLEFSRKCVMYLRGILRNVEGREVFGNVQHWQTSLRRLCSTGSTSSTRPCSWLYRLYFVSSIPAKFPSRYRDRNFPKEETPPTLVSSRGTAQTFLAINLISTSTTCFWITSLEIPWCKDVQLLFKWKLYFQCDLRWNVFAGWTR